MRIVSFYAIIDVSMAYYSIFRRGREEAMISVVVIGRNEGERLSRCMESVHTALGVLAHEIVYVDSHSADDSLARAKA